MPISAFAACLKSKYNAEWYTSEENRAILLLDIKIGPCNCKLCYENIIVHLLPMRMMNTSALPKKINSTFSGTEHNIIWGSRRLKKKSTETNKQQKTKTKTKKTPQEKIILASWQPERKGFHGIPLILSSRKGISQTKRINNCRTTATYSLAVKMPALEREQRT